MDNPSSLTTTLAPPRRARWGYFARRVVYPQELPSIMRKHIYTGAMGTLYYSLSNGIFFIYFGTAVGMTEFQWGVMGGVASFLLTAQLISALLTQRLGHRKPLWFAAAIVCRAMRFLGIFAALALWHLGWPHASVVLIVFIALANFFGAMAEPPWLSWLADIIPERDHGGFWGRRSAFIAFVVVLTVVPAGLLIDRVPEAHKLAAVMGVFLVAAVLGFADLFIHGTIPEPPLVRGERRPLARQLLVPLRDRNYRRWLTFNGCWTYSMTLGGALATLYFVEHLGLKRNFVGGMIVLTALTYVGSIVTGTWSGRLVDRLGPKRVLYWGHLGWAVLPAFWLFATPGLSALLWLGFSSLVGGTSSTAAVNAATKLITRLPPAPDRPMYVAVSSCIGNIAGGLGVFTAGTVLRLLGDWHVVIMGWTFAAFHITFIASLCLRLTSALVLIPRVRDLPARPQC